MNKIKEKAQELDEHLKSELGDIEMGVLTKGFTLADAIRQGSLVTVKAEDWGDGDSACAMSAAVIAAARQGFVRIPD